MKQEYIIDKEFRDMLISWFENIEDTCNKLTSGNVSHQGATIRNNAIRCTTFIKKYTKVEEQHTKKRLNLFMDYRKICIISSFLIVNLK